MTPYRIRAVVAILLVAACAPASHSPQTRYQLSVEARAHFERGDLRPAQRTLAVLARDARDPVAWCNLGIVEYRNGNTTAAERAWNAALEYDSRHARAHYWLGVAARGRAQSEPETRRALLEAAAHAFEAAANADPTSAPIHDALASTYQDLGRADDVARVRGILRRIDPAGGAVAVGAAELGAIELPPRPQSAGGRVPLAFHAQAYAHKATGVAAADVDADGRADLVLQGTNVFLRTDSIPGGGVQFTALSLGDIGRIVTAVPLLADRDERTDLLLVTEGAPPAAAPPAPPAAAPAAAPAVARLWLLRSGSRVAQPVGGVDAEVRAAVAADVDRDGDPDLVLAAGVTPGVRVWRNDGDGGFTAAQPPPPGTESLPPLRQVACADFDGDHRVDLVVTDAAGRLRYLLQGTTGGFVDVTRSAGLAPERARTVDAADIDGDGRMDLVMGNHDGLWVLANRGDGRFGREAAYRAPRTAYAYGARSAIGVAAMVRFDLDNDGGEDILTLHPRRDFAAPMQLAAPAKPAAHGGASAAEDAAPELPLPVAREAATLALWRATGRGILQGLDDRFDAGEAMTGGVAAADFDLDGDLDVACVRPDSVVVVHWNGGGNANRRLRVTLAGPGTGTGARAALGARVEVHAGDLVHVSDVSAGDFCLGVRNLERLDVIRVAWPDGGVDNWLDVEVPADGRLVLQRPAREQ